MPRFKKTKLDFSAIRRKSDAKPLQSGMVMAVFQPAIVKFKQPYFPIWKLGTFALSCTLILAVFSSLSYFSSAQKAQNKILGAAASAYGNIDSAQDLLGSKDYISAGNSFASASIGLNSALNELNKFKPLVLFSAKAKSADSVLTGAALLAQTGKNISDALGILSQIKITSDGIIDPQFNNKLSENNRLLQSALTFSRQAIKEFDSARNLPAEHRPTVQAAKLQARQLEKLLTRFVNMQDLYLSLFSNDKTYLLLFANSNELRANGGFLGTYGVLKADNGKIKKLAIESIYSLDGSFYSNVASPGPFQTQVPQWGIRDANWFADFSTSAQKIASFYESAKETVDGVILFTPAMFEDLLDLVGPIHMPQYGVALTSDNFQETVQYKTSVDFDRNINEPKKFLADLAPILLNRLGELDEGQWFKFFQLASDNLAQRNVLAYSQENATQEKIKSLSFGGEVVDTPGDYLSIINSNMGGTKTDLSIHQAVELKTKALSDGTLINTLKIIYKNSGKENNSNYARILVPKTSLLLSASGMDLGPHFKSEAMGLKVDPSLAAWDKGELEFNKVFVREEAGKTEFAFWSNAAGGQRREVALVYSLPFNKTSYSLLLQKQAGANPIDFKGEFDLGAKSVLWYSDGVLAEGEKLKYASISKTDNFWSAVFERSYVEK